MTIPGLPPELQDLLERLDRRGIAVTPPELARLRLWRDPETAAADLIRLDRALQMSRILAVQHVPGRLKSTSKSNFSRNVSISSTDSDTDFDDHDSSV